MSKKKYSLQCYCSGIFSVTMLTSSFCEGTFMLPLPRQNCLRFDPQHAEIRPQIRVWVKLLSLVSSVRVCTRKPFISLQTPPSETMTVVFRLPFDWFQDITPPCIVLDWSFSVSFSDSFSIDRSLNNNAPGSCVFSPFLLCVLVLGYFILFSELTLAYVVVCQGNSFCFHLSASLLFPAASYWTCLVSISAWNYPKPN